MTDRLAGKWNARACGFIPIGEEGHLHKVLREIQQRNGLGFNEGMMSALNGIRSQGGVDCPDLQLQEAWS